MAFREAEKQKAPGQCSLEVCTPQVSTACRGIARARKGGESPQPSIFQVAHCIDARIFQVPLASHNC